MTLRVPFVAMRKVLLHISGTLALPLVESTLRFSLERERLGILMQLTRPCFGPLGLQVCPSLSVLAPRVQEATDWEMEDDTWLGLHRHGRIEVEGPYYLDGSAF